jgi:sensor domain CHASE-containing protein
LLDETIRRRIALGFVAIAIVSAGIINVLHWSFLRGYSQLDRQFTIEAAQRAHRTYLEQFEILKTKARDWSSWNDAFDYVRTRDPAFATNNITDLVMSGLQVHLLAYLDSNLEVISATELVGDRTIRRNPGEVQFLAADHPLIVQSEFGVVTGILDFGGRPAMVAAMRVTRSDGSGPPSGRVVFVRLIDDELLRLLQEQTLLDVSLRPQQILPPDAEVWEFGGGTIAVTGDTAIGQIPLQSMRGKSLAVLHIKIPRDVMAHGHQTAGIFISTTGFLFFLLIVTTAFVIHALSRQRNINQRLQLSQQFEEAQSIAQIGSWETDLRTMRLSWTPEMYRLCEIDPQTPPENLFELSRNSIHPDDLQQMEGLFQHAIQTGEGYKFKYRLLLDGGQRTKYLECVAKVSVDLSGRPIRISGTIQNVTAREQLEVAVEQERMKAIQAS